MYELPPGAVIQVHEGTVVVTGDHRLWAYAGEQWVEISRDLEKPAVPDGTAKEAGDG